MRRLAIETVNAGFPVIPLRKGDKKPFADKGDTWKTKVCRDALDVLETWPGDECNVGIVTGGGFMVLDVDVNGKPGLQSLANLEAEIGPLPTTRRVRTWSGGWHYYFSTSGDDVSNGARALQNRFGEGLDVRGEGGQAVAPGSIVNDKPYELECDAPIAPLPPALRACLLAPVVKADNAATVVCELDKPENIVRARQWLDAAPEVFEGGRDTAAYEIAARFYDFGVSEATCRELLDEWSEKKCNPSISDDDVDRVSSSAWRNRQAPIGRDSFQNIAAEFGKIEHPPDNLCPIEARVWSFDATEAQEAAAPVRPWIAHRRLIRGKLSSLVAPGSIGKSLLTLQWACAVAMGRGEWCGLDVREQSNVLVINNEDEKEEMGQRLAAVIRHFNLPREEIWHRVKLLSGANDPLIAVRRAARGGTLAETDVVDLLSKYCERNRIGVIIVDPLVDTHEANENDNSEMSRVMRTFRKLATSTGASVLLVHHTKKPPQASADGFAGSADAGRGASSVVNAVRVGMTLFNMGDKDALRFNVPANRRHLYVRLDDAKANLFLASPIAQWFERKTVVLPNGEESGALQPVQLVDRTLNEAAEVLEAIAAEVPTSGDGVTVSALAKTLIGEKFFAGLGLTAIKNRIVANLLIAGEMAYGGKVMTFHRVGDAGGFVTAIGGPSVK